MSRLPDFPQRQSLPRAEHVAELLDHGTLAKEFGANVKAARFIDKRG
jgi:hypothetical protein